MNKTLSPLQDRFVASMNTHDSDAFTACFADDAVVKDEGHTHYGAASIKEWIGTAFANYSPVLEVSNVQSSPDGSVITGKVSGTFPGSPIMLSYHLTHNDHLITNLRIE